MSGVTSCLLNSALLKQVLTHMTWRYFVKFMSPVLNESACVIALLDYFIDLLLAKGGSFRE